MVFEPFGAADIAPHGARIGVTGLIHDPVNVCPPIGGAGDKARSQGMTGKGGSIQTGLAAISLHQVGKALVCKPVRQNAA